LLELKLTNLHKSYVAPDGSPRPVLDGVDLEVRDGEFLCILGPSGCGKTTLLQLVAGLESPDSGEVVVRGRAVTGAGADTGMVFQEYALFPWLTVQGNVEFGPSVRGVPRRERRERVREFIRLVGLAGFEQTYPHELSGGMRQRAAIARALANDPDLLLMDEPLAALDSQLRESLQQEVLRIWRETGKTVIYVTHSISEAVFLADRVAVLGPRPAVVAALVDISLPRPREREVRSGLRFHELQQELRKVLDG